MLMLEQSAVQKGYNLEIFSDSPSFCPCNVIELLFHLLTPYTHKVHTSYNTFLKINQKWSSKKSFATCLRKQKEECRKSTMFLEMWQAEVWICRMTTRLNKYNLSMIMTELLYSMVLTKSQRQKVNRMRENQFEAVNISNSFKDFCLKARVPKT